MNKSQNHLTYSNTINLGSYYTPDVIVDVAYRMLLNNVDDFNKHTILDSSCGYGSFLVKNDIKNRLIGVDIDSTAIIKAKKNINKIEFINRNSLQGVDRESFLLTNNEKLIVIGNPPYNDTTSIIRNKIKDTSVINNIDNDIKTRDLGMSFLLSYDKLKADYVCVLHPLSYLIKKSNFALLKNFTNNYCLIDSLIISSHEFSGTSKGMAFPILIGLYRRDSKGMDFDFIKNYRFEVKDGGTVRLNDFDTIVNYVQKYPNKKYLSEKDKPVAKFWTLRDINALKRNRTFVDSDTYNTVYIPMEKLPYYCYIDVFKQYADKMPYFIGNCDVIIDNEEFTKIRECFIYQSVYTNSILKNHFKFRQVPNAKEKIDEYFRELLKSKLGWEYAKNIN